MIQYMFMSQDHVEQVAALESQCFHDPWSFASIKGELDNPLSLWVVAVEGNTVVGYVGSQSVMGWADMMNLAVSPAYRRQGIGEALVNALVAHLCDNGVIALLLEVRVSNAQAITLYTKMGFEQVGRRPKYYHNPREDALILRKELVR